MNRVKAAAVVLPVLLAWGHAALADGCGHEDLISAAKTPFVQDFQNPPDLHSDSVMPFRGKVTQSSCEGQTQACKITFQVEQYFFDLTDVFGEVFSIPVYHADHIEVTIFGGTPVPEHVVIGSEWLVVAHRYAANERFGGTGLNYKCGEWIGPIKNEVVYFNNGASSMPYEQARQDILQPVTSAGEEGMNRLRQAIRALRP
ncbi:hypothetical protein PMM47T1_15788 [Pseudomonas sp. M47T1]|uniref:hypothetical protein n=1 Tax=Pseudomonas sp. M47T1 TaxID=1179778 RepID=UPI0002607B65|nr:hypothetical protein [Pseudomonas sp. M47T1]EIK95562.1 hypothetical protein PMM47T1_15788 [Pseudomonas sp. M47T1]